MIDGLTLALALALLDGEDEGNITTLFDGSKNESSTGS